MRSKKEIKKKIQELSKERKELPHYSIFGNNNWGTLDANLEILQANLTKVEVKEALEKMSEYYNGNFPEEEIEKSKMNTYDWLLGNTDEL